jgi:membrane fusion protein, multidrug efflux system
MSADTEVQGLPVVPAEKRTMKRLVVFLLLAGLGAAGYWVIQEQSLARPEPTAAQSAPVRPTPVVWRTAAATSMPVLYRTIGSVQPLASVAIRARVDSVVDQVHFTEGQDVKAGDLLFTLDSRTYDAQLAQAQANLERDRANFVKAQGDVKRYEELVRTNAIARQQLDAAIATANALDATIKADQAQVDAARLSLNFTRITAPMDGRTGTIFAKPGTMVRAAEATPLVNLSQFRPITVAFNLPERHLSVLRASMAAGPVTVQASVRDQPDKPVQGKVTFIDNQIDQSTGTIQVKAQFDNTDGRLWPGAFVDVEVTLGTDTNILTLPDVAVLSGQQGRYVYAVKPDNTVEVRDVKVARVQDGQAVISDGLAAGERVVIEGQSRLIPGTKVVDRNAPADKGTPGTKDGAPRDGSGTSSGATGKEKRS